MDNLTPTEQLAGLREHAQLVQQNMTTAGFWHPDYNLVVEPWQTRFALKVMRGDVEVKFLATTDYFYVFMYLQVMLDTACLLRWDAVNSA